MFKPKIAHEDYSKDMLPSTRKAQFFDILKLNFFNLFVLGLIVLLFTLPIHLLAIGEDLYQANLMATIGANPTVEEAQKVVSSIMTFSLIRNAINVPLLILVAISLGGVARVLRQLCWGEPFTLFPDYFKGVKQNAGQYALIGLIAGILAFISNYIQNISATANGEIFQYLGIVPSIVFILLLAPIAGFAMISISLYSNSFRNNLKIGRVCYFRTFFKTLLALVICLVPFVANIIPNFWCHVIGRLLSTLLVPFIFLGFMLYALNIFDPVVNTNNHPELIKKGLYVDENTKQSQ